MAASEKPGMLIPALAGLLVTTIALLSVYVSPDLRNSIQAWWLAVVPGLLITAFFMVHLSRSAAKPAQVTISNNGLATAKPANDNSTAFFYHLIQNNVDGIALIDENANVFYQSPAAEKISGSSAAEVNGKNGFEFMHPDDRQAVTGFFGEVMARPGSTRQIQYRTRHKEGHYMWIEANVLNLLHSADIKCILVNYRDISAHVEADEKIRLKEKQFRALIENDFDAVVILDKNTKPIYRSPAAMRLTGYTHEDREAQPDFGFVHPNEMPLVRQYWLEAVANPQKPVHFITRMVHKDGHTIWTENVITSFLTDPAINGVVVNYRDITQRIKDEEKLKQSEALYRAVVENSIDLILLFDKTGQVKYRSPSVAIVTGVSNEERRQEPVFGYFHPDDFPQLQEGWETVRNNPGVSYKSVIRVRHKNGHYLSIESSITNLLHVPGIEAVIFNGRDITEREEAELQIRALNDSLEKKVALRTQQLEDANKELEAFSYSVSHDLKAPLRIIEGYAKLLTRPKNNLSEDVHRDLMVISENAIRMSHLINALLNFSRLGRAPLTKKMVDMNALINGAISEIKSGDHLVRAEITAHPLPPALCDQALIYRVWINLIHNAIKYSRKSENPHVEIGITEKEGTQVYFVKDNGVGFDMKNADRLFSVFQRLHKESDFEGTGVGLALVNSIIKKHEGKIWVDAAVNEGATFYFSLPA